MKPYTIITTVDHELEARVIREKKTVYHLGRRDRRAANVYTCDLCFHPITKGQEYTRVAFVDGEELVVLRYHKAKKHEDQCIWHPKRKVGPAR